MADNRNVSLAPSLSPKRHRSNPKNDACHYFSIGDAMFFQLKKCLF